MASHTDSLSSYNVLDDSACGIIGLVDGSIFR